MKALSYLLVVAISLPLSAQMPDRAKLDAYFKALETSNKFMGSVAVAKNGQIIYTKAIGYTDINAQIKATPATKYRIGSITKTFTTVLIMRAVEQNKLSLSQTLNKWYPTVKNAEKITILQLLQHRSGIHNFTNDSTYLTWNTQPKNQQQLVDIIVKGGSDFEPNSTASYSNSNFVLLAFIVEKIYKKTYQQLINELILSQLNLKDTYIGSTINTAIGEAKSYKWEDKWQIESETDMSIPIGAGDIVSTPTDLTKFATALFGGKLVNKQSLAQMQTIKDGFGLGLFPIPFYDKQGFGHTGGIDGFRSVYAYFPQDSLAYVLTSNATNINNNDISIAVLSWFYGKPFDIPTFNNYIPSSTDLDSYVGVYTSKQMPLKITIIKGKNTIIAQATGQAAFTLEPTEKNKFKFDTAGVVLEFSHAEKQMILKQNGFTFTFTKE